MLEYREFFSLNFTTQRDLKVGFQSRLKLGSRTPENCHISELESTNKTKGMVTRKFSLKAAFLTDSTYGPTIPV